MLCGSVSTHGLNHPEERAAELDRVIRFWRQTGYDYISVQAAVLAP